ncbi:septation protein A [Janthinobacterium fluminis]|uniref:Inner membrane-spanning protein YciB n=1 Tax=Janthinobacterium fluminis TaxID=2987524 RepID=A0ABT5JX54_9BURK|nr:septation protein A [Janthinobacterium fluminis]MDC8756745.1 septation protein A [Janthinobacterium fluminis]
MKFLFDYFPLFLFFGAYKWAGVYPDMAHALATEYLSAIVSGGVVNQEQTPIMLATVAGIAATFFQVAYLLMRRKAVPGMLWLSLFIFVVFGGAGIYFHDATFIKWKPTLIYWLFALALLLAHVFFNKNLMRKTMETQIKLPDFVWKKLLFAWIAFLSALGALNLFVAFVVYKNDLSAWVSFKAFGATGIFFVFIIVQTLFLSKYILEEDA